MTRNRKTHNQSFRHRQRGVAMPIVVIGLVAMLAMAGLALDSSHAFVNMTRLQNTSDAAALAADPVSAFGGILISNRPIDLNTAELIHSLFCEVLIAPSYDDDALELLKSKKNRIILIQRGFDLGKDRHRSLLGGVVVQDRDSSVETAAEDDPYQLAECTAKALDQSLFFQYVKSSSTTSALTHWLSLTKAPGKLADSRVSPISKS